MIHKLTSSEVDAQDILRAALNASEDGFAAHRIRRNADGVVEGFTLILINQVGAEPLGGDPNSLAGADVATLLGEGGERLLDAFRRCAETGIRQRVRTTFSRSTLAGTTDTVVVRIDADHLLSTWRDITDQLVEQMILLESLRLRGVATDDLLAVLDGVADAIVALQLPETGGPVTPESAARSCVTFANETAANALGMTTTQVIRSTLVDLVGERAAQKLGQLVCAAATAGEASERIVVRNAEGRVQDARRLTARASSAERFVLVSRDTTHEEWAREART